MAVPVPIHSLGTLQLSTMGVIGWQSSWRQMILSFLHLKLYTGKVAVSPSLEAFKRGVDVALRDMVLVGQGEGWMW